MKTVSTDRSAAIAILSLFIGLGVGTVGASKYWMDFSAKFSNSTLLTGTQFEIISGVAVLEYLRAGRYDQAIRSLEANLDSNLVTAGELARAGHKFKPSTVRALEVERRARQLVKYKYMDPSIREAVDEAFRLVPASMEIGGKDGDDQAMPK